MLWLPCISLFLAVLTFWPFVRRATNNQWKAALVPAAKLQAILFVASWLEYAATYGALQYLISISTFQKDFPPVQAHSLQSFVAISVQFAIMVPIATLISCLFLKVNRRRQVFVLLLGNIAVGLITESGHHFLNGMI